MKKLFAFMCAAMLTLSMAITAFATPNSSVTVTGIVTEVLSAVDADGNPVDVVVENILDGDKHLIEELKTTVKLQEVLGNKYNDKISLLDAKEVRIKGDASLVNFPITVTFKATGVKATDKILVLHYGREAAAWDVRPEVTVGEGTITVKFDKLSPVAFLVDKSGAPLTGDNNNILFPIMVGVVALAVIGGVVITGKKKNA